MDLFPVASAPAGTKYTYMVTKNITGNLPVTNDVTSRTFEVGHVADLHQVGREGDPAGGAGLMWTMRGLELTAYAQTTWWNQDGVCVTLTTPGLLVAPADFVPGAVHQCSNLGTYVESASLTWVGPEGITGHPDAQRFDFQASAPYTNNGALSPRFGATTHSVTGTVYLVSGIGPVEGTVTQQFRDGGGTLVQQRKYDFTLTSTSP
jgi:hypothetical protein